MTDLIKCTTVRAWVTQSPRATDPAWRPLARPASFRIYPIRHPESPELRAGLCSFSLFFPSRCTDSVMCALEHYFGSTDVRFIMALNSNHLDDLWAWSRIFPFLKEQYVHNCGSPSGLRRHARCPSGGGVARALGMCGQPGVKQFIIIMALNSNHLDDLWAWS